MFDEEGLSDANLFKRVRRHDAGAFAALVRRHDAALRRLAYLLLADADSVDPVLQRSYARAWRSAGMSRVGSSGGDSVANWLYRAVYNACVDELRQQPPGPDPTAPDGPRVRLPKASPEQRLAALRALSPAERIPLVLVDGEGFNVQAAARILQRPPGQVAADLDRGRRRWRDMVIGPPEVGASDGVHGSGAPEEDGSQESGSSDRLKDQGNGKDGSSASQRGGAAHQDASEEEPSETVDGVPAVQIIGDLAEGGSPLGEDQPARGSPDIADPQDIVPAAEGAFDSERFLKLKQWFKNAAS